MLIGWNVDCTTCMVDTLGIDQMKLDDLGIGPNGFRPNGNKTIMPRVLAVMRKSVLIEWFIYYHAKLISYEFFPYTIRQHWMKGKVPSREFIVWDAILEADLNHRTIILFWRWRWQFFSFYKLIYVSFFHNTRFLASVGAIRNRITKYEVLCNICQCYVYFVIVDVVFLLVVIVDVIYQT